MTKLLVSYSQFSMWNQCPFRWFKVYVEKYKDVYPSVPMLFGTAMHYVLQIYLTALYTNGSAYAEQLELKELLRETMGKEYKKERNNIIEANNLNEIKNTDERKRQLNELLEHYISKRDMMEFYYDGEKIIDWFLKHRREFFNSVEEELVAIEFPLEKELYTGLEFIGYIDVLIRNKKTKKYRIIDFKFSKNAWGQWKKNDINTTDQLVLYKTFYSECYKINPNDIIVEFIIFKRKLYDDIPYHQKRIVKFIPAAGKPTMNKTKARFGFFLDACFDKNGKYKVDGIFPKIPFEKNCRYCPFVNKPEICDKKN